MEENLTISSLNSTIFQSKNYFTFVFAFNGDILHSQFSMLHVKTYLFHLDKNIFVGHNLAGKYRWVGINRNRSISENV